MPVASATDGGHRDCPVLASVTQWPEIQPLVSRGQIVSGVLPLLTDRQTHRRTTIILAYKHGLMCVHVHVCVCVCVCVCVSTHACMHACV